MGNSSETIRETKNLLSSTSIERNKIDTTPHNNYWLRTQFKTNKTPYRKSPSSEESSQNSTPGKFTFQLIIILVV